MDKLNVKQSITGMIKTISGNVKPSNDNLPLIQSLSFTQNDITKLMQMVSLNFMIDFDIRILMPSISLNQLVDFVCRKLLSTERPELA